MLWGNKHKKYTVKLITSYFETLTLPIPYKRNHHFIQTNWNGMLEWNRLKRNFVNINTTGIPQERRVYELCLACLEMFVYRKLPIIKLWQKSRNYLNLIVIKDPFTQLITHKMVWNPSLVYFGLNFSYLYHN